MRILNLCVLGFFSSVLPVWAGPGTGQGPTVKIETASECSAPRLTIDGKPAAPVILFVNLHDIQDPERTRIQLREIADAAKKGVNFVSLTVGMPWDGTEEEFECAIDRHFDAAIAANPNVLLIPRLNPGAAPVAWAKANPDEITWYRNPEEKVRHGSPSSRKWRALASAALERAVKHIEDKYSRHVLGYHICGQQSEWFFARYWRHGVAGFEPCAIPPFREFLKERYGTDARLRKAWNDPLVTLDNALPPGQEERTADSRAPGLCPSRKVVDFSEFQNREMADSLIALCSAVKRQAPGKLTFAFYGYHFEMAAGFNGPHWCGHFAMERVLNSPAVDVLCAPASYRHRRGGGGGYFPSAIDSVMLHNKLWLIEDDIRTWLDPKDEKDPDRCWNPGMADERESFGVIGRDFASALIHGTGLWWMDLWGRGWFSGDDMWNYLGKLDGIYKDALVPAPRFSPEIAVIVDDGGLLELSTSREIPLALLTGFRDELYRIGASSGYYYLGDLLSERVPEAKLYIMVDCFRLSDSARSAIQKRLSRTGASVLWMWAPGIVDAGIADPANVAKTVGMELSQIAGGGGKIRIDGAAPYDAGHGVLSPSFAVADPAAVPLADYVGGGVAVAAKRVDGRMRFYSGVLDLPSSLLRRIAVSAGVHIYVRSDDIVMAGNEMISIHAVTDGEKTIFLPHRSELENLLTGKRFPPSHSVSFKMKKGDTAIFRMHPMR